MLTVSLLMTKWPFSFPVLMEYSIIPFSPWSASVALTINTVLLRLAGPSNIVFEYEAGLSKGSGTNLGELSLMSVTMILSVEDALNEKQTLDRYMFEQLHIQLYLILFSDAQ